MTWSWVGFVIWLEGNVATLVLAFATVVLAIATIALWRSTRRYADETAKIARAAGEQAEASRQMAEEMAAARFASALPIIVFTDLDIINPSPYPVRGENQRLPVPFSFQTFFYNEGTGPALDIECEVNSCNLIYAGSINHPLLGTDLTSVTGTIKAPVYVRERANVQLKRTTEEDLQGEVEALDGVIMANYRDIYGKSCSSSMDFHYDRGMRKIILRNLRLN